MNRLFCFGLGYTAQALGRALRADGWTVAGTARTPDKVAALAADGTVACRFDGESELPGNVLAGATHLLTSIPPDADGDPVLRAAAAALAAAAGDLCWIGYLSTTGVYGNRDGGWVDETDAPAPSSPRARRRVAAEAAWLDFGRRHGLAVHVFRLAGIYGPGRSPIDTLRAGRARRIVKPGQMFSRIHVEDIVAVLRASITSPAPGTIYNVCDDLPAPPQDVVAHAARLIGVAAPPEQPYETADLSPMARSFYLDNRRVRNDRIKERLGVRLRYPTYREGLASLVPVP